MKVGDIVKIVKIVYEEPGWENSWAPDMDEMVGREGVVLEIKAQGVRLSNAMDYHFPPSSLEVQGVNAEKKLPENFIPIPADELASLKKDALLLELLRENGLEDWPFYQESLKSLG